MGKVGILTFHCADNYGAMLQAYGLKKYLRGKNIAADIVPYEPPFMTGRHWWIPYKPAGSIWKCFRDGYNGWCANLEMKQKYFERRANMRQFRKKFLSLENQKKLYFVYQLRRLSYQSYIVGSDQIWNPDITFGLRKAYFGAFENKTKKKVIAYAASLGGTALTCEHDEEFSKLIQNVNAVSVRESAAIPYIKRFYQGNVFAVVDPVFLLEKREWQKIEKAPNQKDYVFVYMTEYNKELVEYVKELSRKKNLLILQVRGGGHIDGKNVTVDCVAGPAEFLGYMRRANYVVTNSFHGVAFSIIFQKKFVVFQHSSVGERIDHILKIHNLEHRVYRKDKEIAIDGDIDWDKVIEHTRNHVKQAEDFLLTHAGDCISDSWV